MNKQNFRNEFVCMTQRAAIKLLSLKDLTDEQFTVIRSYPAFDRYVRMKTGLNALLQDMSALVSETMISGNERLQNPAVVFVDAVRQGYYADCSQDFYGRKLAYAEAQSRLFRNRRDLPTVNESAERFYKGFGDFYAGLMDVYARYWYGLTTDFSNPVLMELLFKLVCLDMIESKCFPAELDVSEAACFVHDVFPYLDYSMIHDVLMTFEHRLYESSDEQPSDKYSHDFDDVPVDLFDMCNLDEIAADDDEELVVDDSIE